MSAPKGFPGDSHIAALHLQDDSGDNLVLGICNGFNPVLIQHFLISGRGLSSAPAAGGSTGAAGILARHTDPKSRILWAQLGWRTLDTGIGAT